MILKFTGDDSVLISMGYTYNEHGRFYCKGQPDVGLCIWKETKEITLNPYTKELTKLIFDFLTVHKFEFSGPLMCLTYDKVRQRVEEFSWSKHTVIGAYGMDYIAEEASEMDDKYSAIQLMESQLENLAELFMFSLII